MSRPKPIGSSSGSSRGAGDDARSGNNNNKVIKRYDNLFGKLSLIIYHSSITECESSIQAIVNPTGSHFDVTGGVAKALCRACGSELKEAMEEELSANGELQLAQARVTPAFKLIQHKYIVHVRSPTLRCRYQQVNKTSNKLVSMLLVTYQCVMRKCFEDLGLSSLGTPLVSTGVAGLPYEESMSDLLEAMHSLRNDLKGQVYVINNDRTVIDPLCKFVDEKLKSYTDKTGSASTPSQDDTDETSRNLAEQSFQADDADCVICMEKINPNNMKKLECGHKFCRKCIDDYFAQVKKVCPICQRVFAVIDGTQPDGGTMRCKVLKMSLPGYEPAFTIEIVYSIPNGVQTSVHPNPGRPYQGCIRTAYLPNTNEGQRVCELLKKAFHHKLIFTVGQSRTTGVDNVVTWNDIHHKTAIHGGPTAFGYPDQNYLSRVIQELASKGIQ